MLPSQEVLAMLKEIPLGMQAGAIMADPGIAFRAYSAKGEGRSPQRHYHCSPLEDLMQLPVAEIAAPDCCSCGCHCAQSIS